MCRSTRPAELRVPALRWKTPRCRGGTVACTGVLPFFSACFRLCFPGTVHRASGTTPLLSASKVPLIAAGTFRVLAVPRRTPSAPRSKPLLDSEACLLLANYPTVGLHLTSVRSTLGIAARQPDSLSLYSGVAAPFRSRSPPPRTVPSIVRRPAEPFSLLFQCCP